jgi:nitrous oxidase accessory protein NosD
MSKEKSRGPKKNAITDAPDSGRAGDPDKMFAAGEMSLSRYIAAKKNVVLSGTYKLDAPVVVDGEEIVVSGGNKPLIIEAAFHPAFSVNNSGKLRLINLELRMPPEMLVSKPPVKLNILGNKFNIPGFGAPRKSHSALVTADNGSIVELHDMAIDGAADCGVKIGSSELSAQNSEISRCKSVGIVLENSSASFRKLTLAENGTRGMINAQVLMEKSAAVFDNCTVRTSREGDGIAMREDSRAEIRGGSISGNSGNGLSLYDSSSADITDCKITENGFIGKTFAQICLVKSSATLKNSSVTDSRGGNGIGLNEARATIESCAIKNNASKGISVINSSVLEISDCTIRDNGAKNKIDGQIYIEKSSATIEKCSVNEGGIGVTMAKEARVVISGCTIKGNAGNAVSAFQRSRVELKNCRISGNGREKKVFAQIFLDNSIADVSHCEITEGVGGPGIALFKQSEISVTSCVISKNSDNGITAFRSPRVEIRDCKMMWNGTVGDCYAHIYLEMSNAIIERCHLFEGHYGYAVYIHGKKRAIRKDSFCNVELYDSTLERNRLGLRVDNLSKLRMSGCKVIDNKEGQIYFEPGALVTVLDDDSKTTD